MRARLHCRRRTKGSHRCQLHADRRACGFRQVSSRARALRANRCKAGAAEAIPRTLTGDIDWDRVDWDTYDWRDYVEDERGPAYEQTLRTLEWPTICEHIANFASTTVGKRACANLEIGRTPERTLRLQAETRAVEAMEQRCFEHLEFGGIDTDVAATALRRTEKGGVLDGSHLLALARLSTGTERLQGILRKAHGAAQGTRDAAIIDVLALRPLDLATCPNLAARVAAAITDDGRIADGASDDVRRCRAAVSQLRGKLRGVLERAGGEVATYKFRMCVAVPSGSDRMPTGMVLGVGAGGSVSYVEPGAAVPLNNRLEAATGELLGAEETVLLALTADVEGALDELNQMLDTVGWLDVAVARHRYTEWLEGTLPEFREFPWARAGGGGGEGGEAWLRLRRLRHPLLQGWRLQALAAAARARTRRGGGVDAFAAGGAAAPRSKAAKKAAAAAAAAEAAEPPPVVPVDITVPPAARAVVITGPNTGGKTASLKALGLTVLLAKAGCGVPAAPPARMPHFSSVLADVGDGQSLSESLSTFSGHLRRIQAARAEADGDCLMLLDEVGTGTDPLEGAALGAALLERLAEGGPGGAALTLATTHMSALTGLKYDHADGRFENASAEFDEATLAPTYRLLWGVPGRSNAFNIAERLGLPHDVVQSARDVLGASQVEVDSLVAQLEVLQKETAAEEEAAEAAAAAAAPLERHAAAASDKAEDLEDTAEVSGNHILGAAARKLLDKLRNLQQLEALKRRQAKEAEFAKFAQAVMAEQERLKLEEVRTEKKEVKRVARQKKMAGWVPAVGEQVVIPGLAKTGTVLKVKGQKVSVNCGNMAVSMKLKDVMPV